MFEDEHYEVNSREEQENIIIIVNKRKGSSIVGPKAC